MEMLYNSVNRQVILETAWSRLLSKGIFCKLTKIQGGIPSYKMDILDTEKKPDPRNTNRFLLSYEKLRSLRSNWRVWAFSGTVCVDTPWDASEDLLETWIARGEFMEAEVPVVGSLHEITWGEGFQK